MDSREARLLPGGVPRWVRIYDNGGETCDRYTVVFTGRYPKASAPGLGTEWCVSYMSEAPFHPQGVGIFSAVWNGPADIPRGSSWPPAMGRRGPLGRRIPFSALPPDCQRLTIDDYRAVWGLSDG